MPPTFLQLPFVKDVYREKEGATFIAIFRSKFKANTSVSWLHNGSLPKNAMIVTKYPSVDGVSPAKTILRFSEITQQNAGNYTLAISNNFTLIPRAHRTTVITFTIIFYGTYVMY